MVPGWKGSRVGFVGALRPVGLCLFNLNKYLDEFMKTLRQFRFF